MMISILFRFYFVKIKFTKTHKTEEKLKQEIKENLKVVGQLLSNDYSYRYNFFKNSPLANACLR